MSKKQQAGRGHGVDLDNRLLQINVLEYIALVPYRIKTL